MVVVATSTTSSQWSHYSTTQTSQHVVTQQYPPSTIQQSPASFEGPSFANFQQYPPTNIQHSRTHYIHSFFKGTPSKKVSYALVWQMLKGDWNAANGSFQEFSGSSLSKFHFQSSSRPADPQAVQCGKKKLAMLQGRNCLNSTSTGGCEQQLIVFVASDQEAWILDQHTYPVALP